MKVVILLSGGMDSVVSMYMAVFSQSYDAEIHPLFIQYGQRNLREFWAAKLAVELLQKKEGERIKPLFIWHSPIESSSGLSQYSKQGVATNRTDEDRAHLGNSYVPGRNLIFLSIAASYSETIGAKLIYVGFSSSGPEDVIRYDESPDGVNIPVYPAAYPDTTDKFVEAFQKALLIGTTHRPLICTPVSGKSKLEIAKIGKFLGVDLENTFSCYSDKPYHCGECDACIYRFRALNALNALSKTEVQSQEES